MDIPIFAIAALHDAHGGSLYDMTYRYHHGIPDQGQRMFVCSAISVSQIGKCHGVRWRSQCVAQGG
jgi:hypothetical protein